MYGPTSSVSSQQAASSSSICPPFLASWRSARTRFSRTFMPRTRLEAPHRGACGDRNAFLWYLTRNGRAAERFEAAIEECVSAILESPQRWPEIEPGIRRRFVFHRFPYAMVYRIVGDEIQIVAVMHLHRRPGYWRR
jgi:plasmid stabilization system protein ParE